MIMMIAYLIIFSYIAFSVFQICASQYVLKWMKKEERQLEIKNIDMTEAPDILIMIPALREISLVEDTMEYFLKLKYPKSKYKIIFITTILERMEKEKKRKQIPTFYQKINSHKSLEEIAKYNEGLFPLKYINQVFEIINRDESKEKIIQNLYALYDEILTTRDYIQKVIAEDPNKYANYSIIECTIYDTNSGKPTQLNYAVEHINSIIKEYDKDRLLLGVYDFDSRPDLRTLSYIAFKYLAMKQQGQKTPDFYQQTQLPYKNIADIDVLSTNKLLMKANVIMYTRRALGIEIFKLLRYKKHINKGKLSFMKPVINCIGAGMFIKLDVLREIGGFAEPVEDLVLGYKLNIKNKMVVPIPYVNMMQPYLYMKSMINSHSRIFMIGLRLYREKSYIEAERIETLIPAVKEFMECVIWLLCAPIMWGAFIYLFLYESLTVTSMLIIITIFLRFWFDFLQLERVTKDLIQDYEGYECRMEFETKQLLIMLVQVPILGVIRFLSALIGVGKYYYFYILQKKVYRKKTER